MRNNTGPMIAATGFDFLTFRQAPMMVANNPNPAKTVAVINADESDAPNGGIKIMGNIARGVNNTPHMV